MLERLNASGPKRILSLDGGGIRGALSLGFLERIETLLRERHQCPTLKLCDYFDLIGGTSTGAVIAGALALGMEATEIRECYLTLGSKVFGRINWKRWQALFDSKPLETELKHLFGDITWGDDAVRTGLAITTKRADTGQTWIGNNHPEGRAYTTIKDIPLWRAIRASTATPVYFIPEKFELKSGQEAVLVDGGLSMANNPALHLFMQTTLKRSPFRWEVGEDNLLLVSVGTGCRRRHDEASVVLNHKLWNWASEIPAMFMEDANWHNQFILQAISSTPTLWNPLGDGANEEHDTLRVTPLLRYVRYNVWLEPEHLQALGLPELSAKLPGLRNMDGVEYRFDLALIGEKAAEQSVLENHFPNTFDLPHQCLK